MSHSGIQDYTKDFNFLWKADFQIGELSAVGYENVLVEYFNVFRKTGSNYLETYFNTYLYLPLHSSICFFQLLRCIEYTDHYQAVCDCLQSNEEHIIKLFLSDLELAEAILQMYESFQNINCSFLIPSLDKYPKWLQDYSQEICKQSK